MGFGKNLTSTQTPVETDKWELPEPEEIVGGQGRAPDLPAALVQDQPYHLPGPSPITSLGSAVPEATAREALLECRDGGSCPP